MWMQKEENVVFFVLLMGSCLVSLVTINCGHPCYPNWQRPRCPYGQGHERPLQVPAPPSQVSVPILLDLSQSTAIQLACLFRKCPEFLCHIKFKNTLPEPLIDSKLVLVKPDLKPFAPYRVTGLEREHQWEVPMDILQLGLLDTVDLERFRSKGGGEQTVAPEDEAILRIVEGAEKTSTSAILEHKPAPASAPADVTWLRRTEYISSETKNKPTPGAKAPSVVTDTVASTSATRRPSSSTATPLASKNDVIKAIEASFAYRPEIQQLVHPTAGAHVHPVAIYPILPTHLVPSTYAQCTFDADPGVSTVDGVPIAAHGDQSALVKAMSSTEDANDAFIWYYLPATEGRGDADEDEEEGGEQFVYTRDYDVQRIERATAGLSASSTASLTYFVLGVPKKVPASDATTAAAAVYAPVTSGFHLRKRRTPSDHSKNRHSLKITRI